MASGQKQKPTLPSIPIPVNTFANYRTVHTTSQNNDFQPQLAASKSTSRKAPEDDTSYVNPDELFVKYTISEVKNIQSKLRADADAKQQELRLMVGERYRDLLQASTSIISIADSSQRVLGALAEMREAMAPDQTQQKPRSSSVRGKDDSHLKILQSLSAHIKLLLDAPEHLWRLLEKKQHLEAAWLFLLARVVHRALVTEDPEEASWQKEGINVAAQFPLVQRQWETLSQFRPQIAHRATQHLRESTIPSQAACSTILTLHLLDSLPLTEILTTLLSQRYRTLNTLLSRNLDHRSPSRPGTPIFRSRRKNQEVASALLTPPNLTIPPHGRQRKQVVRDVREAITELLDVIWGTMCITRELFQPRDDGQRKSLVEKSLGEIQSDDPPESVLTTARLLSNLPSSTHLLTLPSSVLSYKPYIDLTSTSAHVDSAVLDTKLSAWFDKAMRGLEGRVHAWFAGLDNICEVWGLRRKLLDKLQASHGLTESEESKVKTVLDDGVKERAATIVTTHLEGLERGLDNSLRKAVQDIEDDIDCRDDINPLTFVFSGPPIPSVPQISTSLHPSVSPIRRFKSALRQRVAGRTPLLDRVLIEIETTAQKISEDLDVMNEDSDHSCDPQNQILTMYNKAARASSARIDHILERIITEELISTDTRRKTIDIVVFMGRLCYYLSLSPCMQSLQFPKDTARELREILSGLHERCLDRWRSHAVEEAMKKYDPLFVSLMRPPLKTEFPWPTQPSPQIISALLTITSSLTRLGLPRAGLTARGVVSRTLRDFRSTLSTKVSVEEASWRPEQVQLLWDLVFLHRGPFTQDTPPKEAPTEEDLTQKLSFLRQNLQSATSEDTFSKLEAHIDRSIDLYLPRSQTLLAPLFSLSPKPKARANGHVVEHVTPTSKTRPTTLLPLGAPETGQDYQPAIETVKPSARFGLLLVGSTAMR